MVETAGLVLFHGAGGDRDHRIFLRLEAELESMGVPVARCNFPFRQRGPGRRPPDRMPVLVQSVLSQVEEAADRWGKTPDQLVIGGRSLGGRACSMAVAEGLAVAGLLLLSYPLHPARKPDKLRTSHFPDLGCPILLVQGSSDPLGKEAEFAKHLPAIPGPVTQVWLERTGHDPVERTDVTLVAGVSSWLSGPLASGFGAC